MSFVLDQIIHGDALEVLRTLPGGLVHTCNRSVFFRRRESC